MSTGSNYPNSLDLWADKNAGDDVSPAEFNSVRAGIELLEKNHFPLFHSSVETTVANTITATQVYSITVLGGSIGNNGVLRGEVVLNINSILNGANLTVSLSWGGTSFFNAKFNNGTGATIGTFPIISRFTIHNRNNNPASQFCSATAHTEAFTNSFLVFGAQPLRESSCAHGETVAKDSTANQNIAVSLQWSAASASNSATALLFNLWGRKI